MGDPWTKNVVAFNQRYFRLNESCQRCHSRKQNFYDSFAPLPPLVGPCTTRRSRGSEDVFVSTLHCVV